MSPEEAYKYDATFRAVVDQMRAVLSMYHITPAELRQAAILAATMHDAENIKPIIFKPWDGLSSIPTYPAMFGGDTVYGGTTSGRIQTSKPNFTVQDKQAGLDKTNCICGAGALGNRMVHTKTCNDYNWEYYHPKGVEVKAVTERRTGKVERRDHLRMTTNNPCGSFERRRGDYKATGKSEFGDRRKGRHFHWFTAVKRRNYSVCSCGLSNIYWINKYSKKY